MHEVLARNLRQIAEMVNRLAALESPLLRLGEVMLACWQKRGKVLFAGNGGSAADAMHFAEELVVRFHKNRRALAAMALCDPTAVTCAGNDFGFERVFSRQIEGLGNPGDILVAITTSGNSPNIIKAVEQARKQQLTVVTLLGSDGGALRGKGDIEILIPSDVTHHVQEGHKILFHTLCEWLDEQVA